VSAFRRSRGLRFIQLCLPSAGPLINRVELSGHFAKPLIHIHELLLYLAESLMYLVESLIELIEPFVYAPLQPCEASKEATAKCYQQTGSDKNDRNQFG
jgi:hypothetical protein